MTAQPMTEAGPIVSVRDVFVAFRGAAGAVMALRGADLSVAAGERLLVQGPNGSGKSTLLRVITGEQPVVAGSGRGRRDRAAPTRRGPASALAIAGRRLHRPARPARPVAGADRAGEHGAAAPAERGVDGARPRRPHGRPWPGSDWRISPTARCPELSGGEAQQVAICAAVAHGPRLLLADEPTGELDEASARRVYDMLAQLAAEGTSLIQVSHDPRSAAFADRVVRIRDGRLAEQWAHGSPVEQVPDSRGWIRIPPEVLPGRSVARTGRLGRARRGVVLRPGDIGPQTWPRPVGSRPARHSGHRHRRRTAGPGDDRRGRRLSRAAAVRRTRSGRTRWRAASWSPGRPAPASRPCSVWPPDCSIRSPVRSAVER